MQWRTTANLTDADRARINGVMFDEPFTTYHARRKHHLSSHQLADFRACPLLYRRKKLGLIPDADSPAYAMGRATHVRILEGKAAFDDRFVVGGPINEKTGKPYGSETKAFAEWAETVGKPVLNATQAGLIACMADAVASHARASAIIAGGRCEQVVRAQVMGMDCQIRLDLFSPIAGIVDLKTCDDLDWFASDIRRYKYLHQMAFYRAVLAEAAMIDRSSIPVDLIAVEKQEPYRAGVWRLSNEVLAVSEDENVKAMTELAVCIKTDTWPTGFEEVKTVETSDNV